MQRITTLIAMLEVEIEIEAKRRVAGEPLEPVQIAAKLAHRAAASLERIVHIAEEQQP